MIGCGIIAIQRNRIRHRFRTYRINIICIGIIWYFGGDYIGQVLGNTDAWQDVYSNGYVLNIAIEKDGNRYVGKYILVYSKGDSVRKVEGSDILI